MTRARLRFLPAILLLAAVPAFADTMSFPAVRDNTLFESASGELSSGAGTALFVGRTFQGVDDIRRAVLAFDVSAIPAGSMIDAAYLDLNCDRTVTPPQDMSLHFVTESWGEGTSDSGDFGTGVSSTAGDATWAHRFYPGTFWTTPGGSFNAAASAVVSVDAIGPYTWGSTPAMVADVQSWLDAPAGNNGWLLLGDESHPGTTKRFDSRESATNPPQLRVDYTPPSVPVEGTTWTRIKTLLGS